MADYFFVSDDDFRTAYADALGVAGDGPDRLTAQNRRRADDHHREAAAFIRSQLLARGVPESAIKNWSRGRDFERNIGLYFAYRQGSLGEAYNQEAIDGRRKDWYEPLLPPALGGDPAVTADVCPPAAEPAGAGGVSYGAIACGTAAAGCGCGARVKDVRPGRSGCW